METKIKNFGEGSKVSECLRLVCLHWFELAKEHWTQVYRSIGTPCSCPMCRGYEYDRLEYKRETRHITHESMD